MKIETPMAKTPTKIPATQPENPISLTDYCKRLSVTERRHTLIASFFYTEKVAGRLTDTPSAYAKRFAEHINTPAI